MSKSKRIPIALTIAGSDSGGGAGIQADLKTFAAIGVHGTSVITCLTAQNPRGVIGIEPASPSIVRKQIEAVMSELRPGAVKTGMLYSDKIIREVANAFRHRDAPKLIVDPVMVATSGARLLTDNAIGCLERDLLPLAALITPNLDEAAVLTGTRARSIEDLRIVARLMFERFGCATLIKGGHLRNGHEAADVFYDGKTELLLTAPYVKGVSTHGTGCTYSAAIAAFIARGQSLERAVASAKIHISNAIASSRKAGSHWVLDPFWKFNL